MCPNVPKYNTPLCTNTIHALYSPSDYVFSYPACTSPGSGAMYCNALWFLQYKPRSRGRYPRSRTVFRPRVVPRHRARFYGTRTGVLEDDTADG